MASSGFNVIIDNLPLLLDGLGNTLYIAIVSMVVMSLKEANKL